MKGKKHKTHPDVAAPVNLPISLSKMHKAQKLEESHHSKVCRLVRALEASILLRALGKIWGFERRSRHISQNEQNSIVAPFLPNKYKLRPHSTVLTWTQLLRFARNKFWKVIIKYPQSHPSTYLVNFGSWRWKFCPHCCHIPDSTLGPSKALLYSDCVLTDFWLKEGRKVVNRSIISDLLISLVWRWYTPSALLLSSTIPDSGSGPLQGFSWSVLHISDSLLAEPSLRTEEMAQPTRIVRKYSKWHKCIGREDKLRTYLCQERAKSIIAVTGYL